MFLHTASRAVSLAVLRTRDPRSLSLRQAYELYRADFLRDLRAADRAFRAEPPSPEHGVLAAVGDGAVLAGGLSALAFALPVPEVCSSLARESRGLTLLLAALVGLGAWSARRRLARSQITS